VSDAVPLAFLDALRLRRRAQTSFDAAFAAHTHGPTHLAYKTKRVALDNLTACSSEAVAAERRLTATLGEGVQKEDI